MYEKYTVRVFVAPEQKNDISFCPINIETDSPVLELTMTKDQTLQEIKESIVMKLNLESKITLNKLRLRVISKKGEAERILRDNNNSIKKLKLDYPSNLLLEVLNDEENLDDNCIQLYSFLRDSNNGTYLDKKSLVFHYEKIASSVLLYQNLRTLYKLDNITIAKHTKSYYNWDIIPETEDNAPVNLKKSYYNLKDGGEYIIKLDWIGVRNDDVTGAENDTMQTDEDKKVRSFLD